MKLSELSTFLIVEIEFSNLGGDGKGYPICLVFLTGGSSSALNCCTYKANQRTARQL